MALAVAAVCRAEVEPGTSNAVESAPRDATPFQSSSLKPVVVQLKWRHQFQFAGFYAALARGFYSKEGFDVTLKPATPEINPIDEVVSGRADYGVANSELLLYRMNGAPVTALAVIMQHSPLVFISLKETGILSPQDLIGRRVMLPSDAYGADSHGLLLQEGVSHHQLIQVPLSFSIDDLINKNVDAMVGYITDQPYQLTRRNIAYNVIDPRAYGIDFYGDTLFTHEDHVAANYLEVKRFREATIRGWLYAIDNPEEIIQLIVERYHSEKSLDELRYEAEQTIELIVPQLVSIGHMNPGRWGAIAKVFQRLGLSKHEFDEQGFVFSPEGEEFNRRLRHILAAGSAIFFIPLFGVLALAVFNRRLKLAVQIKTHDLMDTNRVLLQKTERLQNTEQALSKLNLELEQRVFERTEALESARKKMEELAYYDTLTKLENRLLFRFQLEKALSRAGRHRHAQAALLYIDIDNFKSINDTLGHDAGDCVLVSLAKCLSMHIRKEDSAARLSGDEFAVLLTDVHCLADASQVAESILRYIAHPIPCKDKECFITVSIGISMAPSDSNNMDELIKFADLALYYAKRAGKNNWRAYKPEMNSQSLRRVQLDKELRDALKDNQFFLFYQPKVSLSSGELIGVEALIRWQHPEHGLKLPEEFITVAEDSGRIIDIGRWVIDQAAASIPVLEENRIHPVRLSINLSARQMRDERLLAHLEYLVTHGQIKPSSMELEITETSLIENSDECIRQLDRIKALGFALSIDDFGTGYSSLSYLKRLPVDIIKIDKSFLDGVPSDQDSVEIVSGIVAMAHKLRLKVVAEGVENLEQIDFLKDCQCDFAQGFFYGQPMSLDELIARYPGADKANAIPA